PRAQILPRFAASYPQKPGRLITLTRTIATSSNERLFPKKANHETHFPAVGYPAQTDPRLSQPHEDDRWTPGLERTPRQGAHNACRIDSGRRRAAHNRLESATSTDRGGVLRQGIPRRRALRGATRAIDRDTR